MNWERKIPYELVADVWSSIAMMGATFLAIIGTVTFVKLLWHIAFIWKWS